MFKFPVRAPGAEHAHNWFLNSWRSVRAHDADIDWATAVNTYENSFNVRIVIEHRPSYSRISHIEFPDEAAATMFVLRWE